MTKRYTVETNIPHGSADADVVIMDTSLDAIVATLNMAMFDDIADAFAFAEKMARGLK